MERALAGYDLDGHPLALPAEGRDGSVGMCLFPVPLREARRLVPGEQFEPAAVAPGTGAVVVSIQDHRDHDLGPHRAVLMSVLARPRRGAVRGAASTLRAVLRGRFPSYVFQLPVDREPLRAAVSHLWGFPASSHQVDMEYTTDRAVCQLVMHGKHVLTLGLSRRGELRRSERKVELLSYIDGVAHRTAVVQAGEGPGARRGRDVELLLGDHPLADRLRQLGLPRRPLLTVWLEHVTSRLEAPRPIG